MILPLLKKVEYIYGVLGILSHGKAKAKAKAKAGWGPSIKWEEEIEEEESDFDTKSLMIRFCEGKKGRDPLAYHVGCGPPGPSKSIACHVTSILKYFFYILGFLSDHPDIHSFLSLHASHHPFL